MSPSFRARIRDTIRERKPLDQITADKPSLDYDYRYGAKPGLGTTDRFVESA